MSQIFFYNVSPPIFLSILTGNFCYLSENFEALLKGKLLLKTATISSASFSKINIIQNCLFFLLHNGIGYQKIAGESE